MCPVSYRSAHHNLCTLLQSLGLLPHAASTVHRHRAQRVGLAEALTLGVDLQRQETQTSQLTRRRRRTSGVQPHSHLLTQLPGGTHDDGDGPVSRLQLLLVHDVNQHRPDERCSFTAAGFGDSDHVTSRQRNGDALKINQELERLCVKNIKMDFYYLMIPGCVTYLALNGSGLRVLRFANLVHELLIKAEVSKTRTRFWRSGARNLGDTNQRVSVSFTPRTNQT